MSDVAPMVAAIEIVQRWPSAGDWKIERAAPIVTEHFICDHGADLRTPER